jgi:hypothetical protein
MSRWRAFAIHLLISVLIAGSVAAVLFLVWYPPKLLGFAGAEGLLLLMAGIDIVVGPLLTLIVFKAGKKSLKFDLSVIALAQAAFLAYGVWTSWVSRPVFIVAVNGYFEVVFANDIADDSLVKAKDSDYASLPWGRPRLVGANPSASETVDNLFSTLDVGDIAYRPDLYVTYDRSAMAVLARSTSIEDAIAGDPELTDRFTAGQTRYPDARVARVYSARSGAYMLIDPKTAQPLQAVW